MKVKRDKLGRFKKGSVPPKEWYKNKKAWNKGLTKKDERVKKYSESLKNHYKKPNPKCGFKKGNKPWCTGKKLPKLSKRMKKEIREGKRKAWGYGQPHSHFKGENHPNFRNWSSRKPYGWEFGEELREQIRERDNRTCQQCGWDEKKLSKRLEVHHIDYDKQNNNPDNLISLCKTCHGQTNFTREDWIEYFQNKIGGSE